MNGLIESANGWAAHWAPMLWRASWQGGIFIAAVWAVCKACPRMPAATRHWLWWLASAQLLVRLLIASPIALPILPAQEAAASLAISASQPVTNTTPAMIQEDSHSAARNSVSVIEQEPVARPSILLAALGIWWIGFAACLVSLIRRLFKTRSYLQGKSLFDHNELTDLIEEFSSRIGVKPPAVRESRRAPCPLLVGWIKPTIVLPVGAAESLSATELRMAVAHELTHLKRRDLWLSLVPDAARLVFFFHPLAWLAASEIAAAREEACDSEALRLSGGSLAAYARLLFNSAQSSSSAAVMGAAIGYRLIQRRINMLKSTTPAYGPTTRRIMIGVIALAAVCALPWTVTAQSSSPAATRPAPSTHAHAVSKKHVRRTSKHVLKVAKAANQPARNATKAVAINRTISGSASSTSPVKVVYWRDLAPIRSSAGAAAKSATQIYGSTTPASGSTTPASGSTNSTYGSTAPAATTPSHGSTVATGSTSAAAGFAPASTSAQTPAARVDNGRVTVEFEKVSLREAIKVVCKNARLDYSVRSDILEDTVTLSIHNGDPLDVVHAILLAVKQPLTYRRDENGVVQITPKSG